jgi:glycosyltransferase involved in cell wall biosynthesis
LISDEYGVLVNEEDPDAVAHAVEGMLANPEQRAVMGGRGRACVIEEFSWERAAEEYIRVMEDAVAAG